MRYFLVAFALLFAPSVSVGWVDPILENAVERYEVYTGITVKSDVVFSEEFMTTMHEILEDDGIIGICTEYKENTPVVVIDPAKWELLGNRQQTALIWHELEHCERGAQHDDDSLLMGVRILTEDELRARWGEVILELL